MDTDNLKEVQEHLIEIKNLNVQYSVDEGVVYAVNNLNLAIGYSETLGLVGETGAGKTTTARAILGLLPRPVGKVTQGEILLRGENLLELDKKKMKKVRGKQIAMIFQDPMTSLNPVLRVGDQISEVILIHEKVSRLQAKLKAGQLLTQVGIKEERINDYPHQFSGGMKQRVVIAIALACNPHLLIADEPTTALDVTIQAQILDLMKNLKQVHSSSMILITHDLGVVAEICDKVAIMYAGSVVEYATKEELYENPKHPYTNGLFKSIPDLDLDDIEELSEIPGLPPDPTEIAQGCSFASRCKDSMDVCEKTTPSIFHFSDTHYVYCHKFAQQGMKG